MTDSLCGLERDRDGWRDRANEWEARLSRVRLALGCDGDTDPADAVRELVEDRDRWVARVKLLEARIGRIREALG